jgi:alpha,alpha-trehalase
VDYNFVDETRSQALTLAGLYPLWAGLVSNEQALRMEQTLRTSFLREGGLVTSLRTSGEQWDAPNGWAPLQFLAIEGLERYGFNAFAEDIAQRWAMTCFRMFKRFGALMEKYNVEYPGEVAGGGEYAVQDGFGWTNAVLLVLMNRYGIEYDVDTV